MATKRSKPTRPAPRHRARGGQISGYDLYNYPGPMLSSIEVKGGERILNRAKADSRQNLLGRVKLVDGRLVVTGPKAGELKELLRDLRSFARVKDDEALFKVIPNYFRGGLVAHPLTNDKRPRSNASGQVVFSAMKVTDDVTDADLENFMRKLAE